MRPTDQHIKIVNPKAESIAEGLGITPERRGEIQKRVDELCKNELERESEDKEPGSMDTTLLMTQVWNEFEVNEECAYALLILDHEENKVGIKALFALPESVSAE